MAISYSVPTEDIRFALFHIATDGRTADGLDETLLDQVLREAGRFAIDRLLPLNLSGDRIGSTVEQGRVTTAPGLAEAYRDWAAAGWMGVSVPEIWGGTELPPLFTAPLDEVWNSANMSFYVCPTLTQAALKLLLAHGTREQKQSIVPHLAAGRWTASMGLTEPQAGSDLSLICSKAQRQSDGSYLITGSKVFTSFGDHDWSENIINLVLARIEGAPAGSRGISLFIVPKVLTDLRRNDIVCTGVEHKLGLRASPTCSMAYGAEKGAIGYLLGEPNAGLSTMFVMMNKARIACALQGLGIAERALQQARAYSEERVQGRYDGATVQIAEHPDIRRMVLRMHALTLAARAITYTSVAAVEAQNSDGGEAARGALLTPIAKVFSSEAACEVSSINIQVHGGLGYVEETGASQLLRDARAIPIYEGTNGIQAIDLVMRKVLPDDGKTLYSEIERLRTYAAAVSEVPGLADFGGRLNRSFEQLERATHWLLTKGRGDDARLAAASPFTALAGTSFAGGYIAKGLVSASRSGSGPPPNTLPAAKFYGTAILPATTGYADDVCASETLGC